MNSFYYNSLYAKAQLMADEDEFQIRCRNAYETKVISEDEYKKLLAFRAELRGSAHDKPTSAKIETGVK